MGYGFQIEYMFDIYVKGEVVLEMKLFIVVNIQMRNEVSSGEFLLLLFV